MEKPFYLLVLFGGILTVISYPMGNEEDNRDGYFGSTHVSPEMVGLMESSPKVSSIDESERLTLRESMPAKRSLRESKKLPFISGISRKRFGHVSMIRPFKTGITKKRSVRKSKRSPVKSSKKRSVNELDMPPYRKSSIQIEAFDSKSTIQSQVKSPVETAPVKSETPKSENITVTNETASEAKKNETKEGTTSLSDEKKSNKVSSEFPSAEDNLLQMTHNLLSDITEFHDSVDDVKEATVTQKGEDLQFEENVEKRAGERKRNEIAAGGGGSPASASPMNVLVSKSIFEDYLINRFISYVCGAEC